VNHIALESQSDAVKQFFLGLPADPAGSVVELGGHALACVVPLPFKNGEDHLEWTDAKNERRCDLIERKYRGALTAPEAMELAALQEEMLRYRQKVAPLALEDARRLHQELLLKAMLGLDSQQSTELRMLWMGIIALAECNDAELHKKLLGFPDEMPDLKRLRPLAGNIRPTGVEESHFARRALGKLPAAY